MKEKKTAGLEKYEKEYLARLTTKKKTKSPEQKKPAAKKTKKKVAKKPTITKTKKPRKSVKKIGSDYDDDNDTGIVLIDDDLNVDEQTELEERKAYLEEARSQESSD